MRVFLCIFAMVLRHVYFIVKTYVYCWLLCLQGVILIKSSVKHDALSTYKNNDKTGVFWHAKFIVKTECFHTEARKVAYIIVKTDAWRMWASPLRSGLQVLVRNLTKTLCFWRSCSPNIGFYTCLRCWVAGGVALARVGPCWAVLARVGPCWPVLARVGPCWPVLARVGLVGQNARWSARLRRAGGLFGTGPYIYIYIYMYI